MYLSSYTHTYIHLVGICLRFQIKVAPYLVKIQSFGGETRLRSLERRSGRQYMETGTLHRLHPPSTSCAAKRQRNISHYSCSQHGCRNFRKIFSVDHQPHFFLSGFTYKDFPVFRYDLKVAAIQNQLFFFFTTSTRNSSLGNRSLFTRISSL